MLLEDLMVSKEGLQSARDILHDTNDDLKTPDVKKQERESLKVVKSKEEVLFEELFGHPMSWSQNIVVGQLGTDDIQRLHQTKLNRVEEVLRERKADSLA